VAEEEGWGLVCLPESNLHVDVDKILVLLPNESISASDGADRLATAILRMDQTNQTK